jgi:hypothetical protein
LPSTLKFFAEAIEEASALSKNWKNGEIGNEERLWLRQKGLEALAGEAYRWGDDWKWRVNARTQLDIDMASSGQKANWSILLLAQAMFSWREDGIIRDGFTLHVEEPEIHLHPEAQAKMIEILAYLVQKGFHVVVTTHSLTALYKLNNLLLASALDEKIQADSIPPAVVRLNPEQIAAYHFQADGVVANILDRDARFISEVELGEVGDQLSQEMNHINQLQWENSPTDQEA